LQPHLFPTRRSSDLFKAKITERLLIKAKLIIAVSKEIEEKLPNKLKSNIIVKEAFIPPQMEIELALPPKILNVIKNLNSKNNFIDRKSTRLNSSHVK